jgi:hypothetical protein
MSGGVGQRMRLRLFLEGIEVPVIAAQVQVAPNSPAVCSIQVPPLASGTNMYSRTLVHLFFLDFYDAQSPFASPPGGVNTTTNQSPTAYEDSNNPTALQVSQTNKVGDDPDIRNSKYKLLFGGEVVGFTWTKNQNNRSLVLQCQDWSNYWDYAYQWNNTDLFGPGIKALFSGGSTNLFTDFLEDEGSAILRVLQQPSVQYPNLKGLLGGIVHLLEAIGGSYYQGNQFAGMNIFFSLAELRLHITQMITAYENDPTASRLLQAGYDSLLGRTLGDLGQQVSFRSAINALMGIIFHETYAQCCPYYSPGTGTAPNGQTRLSVRQDADNDFIATTADNLLNQISQVLSTLNAYQGSGASPSDSQRTSMVKTIAGMQATCNTTANQITAPIVLGARSFYATASRYFSQAQTSAQAWRAPASITPIITALTNAQGQLQSATNFTENVSATKVIPARLNQQIFRPDVWFSAPPRCNVLFPENYHSVNYARSFLAEPTRLLLKTNNEFFGEDELFDQFYFAPKGFTIKGGGREVQDILTNNGLFPHELFCGILPVFEKMGELNIFAARSGTVQGKIPKIGLAQRSCNFLYFKYRFAARQLSLSGKFNPYLACGFPALIVDKWVDADTLALRQQLIAQNGGSPSTDSEQLLGTHFLCNLTEVSHSVSQSDGMTSLNCSYARQPLESVEFLGVVRPDQTVQQRSPVDATRISVVAAITPPNINSLGPNQGNITAVQDVTQAYKGQSTQLGQALPLYQGPVRTGTTSSRINVIVGVTAPASDYSADVVNYIGNPAQLVMFKAFRITETVARYRTQTVDLPAEEYIRPGWYGDVWHPALIGQAYQQFFATGAITDQQQAVTQGGASIGVPLAAAQAALAQAAQAVDADDPKSWAAGLMALDQNCSIQDAVSFIVESYSLVKQQQLDVDEYIRNYTWRPIATMVDMFGTSDLTLDSTGTNVIQGIEGFHSRAFGPYNNLFGLVTPNIQNVLGITRGSTVAQTADVRGQKQQAVQTYVSALQFARAILG